MRPLSNKSSNNSLFPPLDCKYDRVLSAHDLASKGWGAIAKLKKKQELLFQFGYNLGELFRDSP